MPPLSLLVETMLGTVTSGSVGGLPLGGVLGNANSMLTDAAESRTNAIKLLIFIFMGGYGLS
jgi:hypothetical protein